ncbi:hypothetical protein BS47DRAFT_947361 [Hydnum rufescens UP504]|uniref:Uncharacterized protein n=1 Tax=Hydnum rufescens UP504 TaxID=1448309 RepID=A0A9P6AXI3_9AGAM|nr:hypothetical protein BS47DRAFT_947361 [Hydnum rufescens UP504]
MLRRRLVQVVQNRFIVYNKAHLPYSSNPRLWGSVWLLESPYSSIVGQNGLATTVRCYHGSTSLLSLCLCDCGEGKKVLELCFLTRSCFRRCQTTSVSPGLTLMSTVPNHHGTPLRAFLLVFFKITLFDWSTKHPPRSLSTYMIFTRSFRCLKGLYCRCLHISVSLPYWSCAFQAGILDLDLA